MKVCCCESLFLPPGAYKSINAALIKILTQRMTGTEENLSDLLKDLISVG